MAKVRANWYEKRGISRERYRELESISWQYDQLKERARKWQCNEIDRERSGGAWGGRPDPTASEAVRRASNPFAWKAAAIEQAAIAADAGIAKYILQNVTRRTTYEQMDVPAGRRQFFAARRRYFFELNSRMP